MAVVVKSRRYAGRTALERRLARRRRLLEAALGLFTGAGYAASSIEALCGAAGVTARHLYEEFGGRQQVLRAAYDRINEEVLGCVGDAIAAAAADPGARVRAGLSAFVHAMLDDPRRARLVFVEVVGVSAEMERHRRETHHRYADLIRSEWERLAPAASMPPRSTRLRAQALVGGVNELVVERVLGDVHIDSEQLVDELVGLFLAAGGGHR
jgi:AcrR family transcriptional regulator